MMRDRNFRIFQQRVPDISWPNCLASITLSLRTNLRVATSSGINAVCGKQLPFHQPFAGAEGISYLFRHDKDGHTGADGW